VVDAPWTGSVFIPLFPKPGIAGLGPAIAFSNNPSTGNICVGLGGGVGMGHSGAIGPMPFGNTFNGQNYRGKGFDSIMSDLSISGGMITPAGVGGQGMINNAGWSAGPSGGTPGVSVIVTYSKCAPNPLLLIPD
jgi:hypothetical protein